MTAYFRRLMTSQLRPSLFVGLSLFFLSVKAQNGLITASLLPGKKHGNTLLFLTARSKQISLFSAKLLPTRSLQSL